MTPVRTRVIHGGEDEQASIERKRSRDDSLGTAVIHGDEDEKGVDPEKESQAKNLKQMLKCTPQLPQQRRTDAVVRLHHRSSLLFGAIISRVAQSRQGNTTRSQTSAKLRERIHIRDKDRQIITIREHMGCIDNNRQS